MPFRRARISAAIKYLPILVFMFLNVGWAHARDIMSLESQELRRIPADEAHQGVAVDQKFFYAIDNQAIGKYDKSTGQRLDRWQGPEAGPIQHLNSCTLHKKRLYCAHSNYPQLPMTSSLEIFDTRNMRHIDSISYGISGGSLTWASRHQNAWWLTFANYAGRGGHPVRDWRWTHLARYSSNGMRRLESWTFPESVLKRFQPRSSSGGQWNADGHLYASGHDRPELYVLALPQKGSELVHLATITVTTEGQAFDFDPEDSRLLYSIDRASKEIVVTQLPPLKQLH